MKRSILSLLIALAPAISYSGDYVPLLEEGKRWNYSYENIFSNYFIYHTLKVGEDIEIKDKTYKIIYDVSRSSGYALREEDKKVYCVFLDKDTPQLIYDFGKNAGEIVSEEIDHNKRTVVKVHSVDSVKYANHILRRMLVEKEYLVNDKLQKTDKSVWIEGIGSPYGLAMPFATSDSYIRFFSCQVGDQGEIICENEQFWVDGVPDVTHQKTIDGLKYYLYPDTHDAAINSENTWVGEFDLPSEVSYNDETYAVRGMSCNAFRNCSTLTKARIPKSIELVIHTPLADTDASGAISPNFMNPFTGCTSLESIEVDEDNPTMMSVGGVLFNKDGTRLYAYPAGKKAESYVVPEGVTWVGAGAFDSNGYLASLELPESISIICGYAFNGCTLGALVIRGILDSRCIDRFLFYGLNESAKLYVQASEIDRYKDIFPGTILPLDDYQTGIKVPTSSTNEHMPLYNLAGQKVGASHKGIVIQNGKKVITK